jgi:hypothetical protein
LALKGIGRKFAKGNKIRGFKRRKSRRRPNIIDIIAQRSEYEFEAGKEAVDNGDTRDRFVTREVMAGGRCTGGSPDTNSIRPSQYSEGQRRRKSKREMYDSESEDK